MSNSSTNIELSNCGLFKSFHCSRTIEHLNNNEGLQTDMRQLNHPETESIALTGVLYALSDPVRLEIVKSLQGGTAKTCGEFGPNA